jgi:Tfp pilus assembly protein PilN
VPSYLTDEPVAKPAWLTSSNTGWYPPDDSVGLPMWMKAALGMLVVGLLAVGGGAFYVGHTINGKTENISQLTNELSATDTPVATPEITG